MSFANVLTIAAVCLVALIFEIYFTVSLILFIIASRHRKTGRDTKLASNHNVLKINFIVSAALMGVCVIAFIIAFAAALFKF